MGVWYWITLMKKNLTWLFWILVLIFVYVLVSRFTQVKELIDTLE